MEAPSGVGVGDRRAVAPGVRGDLHTARWNPWNPFNSMYPATVQLVCSIAKLNDW